MAYREISAPLNLLYPIEIIEISRAVSVRQARRPCPVSSPAGLRKGKASRGENKGIKLFNRAAAEISGGDQMSPGKRSSLWRQALLASLLVGGLGFSNADGAAPDASASAGEQQLRQALQQKPNDASLR